VETIMRAGQGLAVLLLCGCCATWWGCTGGPKVKQEPAPLVEQPAAPTPVQTLTQAPAPAPADPAAPAPNQTLYRHPNPEIEELHVQAYNLDMGIGVPQDREKANQMYAQAAYRGDPRSMFNLASNLATGRGIERDDVEAYSWIEVARYMTQTTRDMKMKWSIRGLHEELKTGLSDEQLQDGDMRARQKVRRIQRYLER
jgi:hypothetical protein